MTPRDFSIEVVRQLNAAGFLAYWAGGCVRDLLRGHAANDFDVATNASPQQVRRVFESRKTLAVGESFGVIIVVGPRGAGQVEVATFRTEGEYTDGRRPDHVEFCSPEEDALRRDFTINGMFFDPIQEVVHDFVGGMEDLAARRIRAIGDPQARMSEDKLRMLRAIRFSTVLDFDLDHRTADAVRLMAEQINAVSAERIAQEFRKMFENVHRARALELLRELTLLHHLLPELTPLCQHPNWWRTTLAILDELDVATFTVAFSAVLRDVPSAVVNKFKEIPQAGSQQAICRRLKLSNKECERICWLGRHLGSLARAEEYSLAELKRMLQEPAFDDLWQLERALAVVEERSLAPYEYLQRQRDELSPEEIDPPELLTGRDLIQLGHRPGPEFRTWLETIRTAQLNNEIDTQAAALQLLERLVAQRDTEKAD